MGVDKPEFVYETALGGEDDRLCRQADCGSHAAEELDRSCQCAARGTLHQVFTCPICVSKALGMFARLDAQVEMFNAETELPF